VSLGVVALALIALLFGLYLHGVPVGETHDSSAEPIPPAPEVDTLEEPQPAGTPAPAGQSSTESEPRKLVDSAKRSIEALPPKKNQSRPETAPSAIRPSSYLPPSGSVPRLSAQKKRYLIFVIDDAGYSMKQLEAFLRLPFPLTISVLPCLPNSKKAAEAVLAADKELILHQPMQPSGNQNPGPGVIKLGMKPDEIERIIGANLETVPGAVGMNNHMGSAATADLGIMDAVAMIAKKKGIYYLDSRTTSDSAVATAARREGIRYWERDVFLDNTPDRASITRAVEDGKKRSIKDRPAIMIGHVWSAELAQTLTDLYPQLIAEGFSLSTISRFMVQEAEEDDASPRD
jgi:hypothetical protein